MKQLPLNRYLISGIENPDNKPWSIEVFAASAEDAWFMTAKRVENEYCDLIALRRYRMERIEAIEPDEDRFVVDLRTQTRDLLKRGVKRVTVVEASYGGRSTVPIEAAFVMVIHPDDEHAARLAPGFMPCRLYSHNRRYLTDEIGSLDGARIVIDIEHSGPPKLYGMGERSFKADS